MDPRERRCVHFSAYIVAGLLASNALAAPTDGRQARAAATTIEFETLVNAVKPSGGQVVRQEMGGFGQGWSGAQLFWRAPAPVDAPIRNWPHLDFSFSVPTDGTYEIVLRHTVAPDFATFRVFLDGQPVADVEGYAPGVAPRARSLGSRLLKAGGHAIVITVFAKSPAAKGYAVGLDRLDLQPAAATTAPQRADPRTATGDREPDRTRAIAEAVRNAGSRSAPGSTVAPTGAYPVLIAQLFFTQPTAAPTKDWPKAGTETTFDRTNPYAHLKWESQFTEKFAWQWQVALQPFPAQLNAAPSGLVSQGTTNTATMSINFGTFAPLNAANTKNAKIDFYIRLVSMLDGKPMGASNVVVAHYVPGSDTSLETTKAAMSAYEEGKKMYAEMEEAARVFQVQIVTFTPAVFEDPLRWGCIEVIKNPYYADPVHKLAMFAPGQVLCPATYTGQSYQAKNLGDVLSGWVTAYHIAADFYTDVKNSIAKQFAGTICQWLDGQAEAGCETAAQEAAGAAMSAGLAASGVPPSLPHVGDLAKGKATELATAFTCGMIENNGGTCTPEIKSAIGKAYGTGLDQLEKQMTKASREPGCGNTEEAHKNGREPLPCFTDYPGTEVKPVRGAVYEPPKVIVQVTRVKRDPSFASRGCDLEVNLEVTNDLTPGEIPHDSPLKPMPLKGYPFLPESAAVPRLAMGQSADLTLDLARFTPYFVPGNQKPGAQGVSWWDWWALYREGKGTVGAYTRTREKPPNPTGVAPQRLSCGKTEQAVQLPDVLYWYEKK
jgi:hypothetical protein